jgi:two-component system, NarL family, response regulator LiaR
VCAKTLQPDVILVDSMMPGMDGITATRLIKEQNPSIQIIALTSFQEDELVQAAIKAGAIGCLTKNISLRELETAIRSANENRMILSPEAAQSLVRVIQQTEKTEILTEREQEVLKFMVGGLNNAEIAKQMVISLSRVKITAWL